MSSSAVGAIVVVGVQGIFGQCKVGAGFVGAGVLGTEPKAVSEVVAISTGASTAAL